MLFDSVIHVVQFNRTSLKLQISSTDNLSYRSLVIRKTGLTDFEVFTQLSTKPGTNEDSLRHAFQVGYIVVAKENKGADQTSQ